MKNTVTFLLVLAMTLSVTACGIKEKNTSQTESGIRTETIENSSAEPIQTQAVSPTRLTNQMTENELQWVDLHELTLLDEFEKSNADPQADHKVSIEFLSYDPQERRTYAEEHRSELLDEEYEYTMQRIKTVEDDTTLEGVAKLKERLESHGADLTYKLYESHHYQYIPEMLIEYLKQTYPC